ncbi:toxin TcdB middle/C-terminal domain-containing protein [Pseudomonas sp. 1152_12]|uniref:toxin TcdB middle/C-terminal domain-containing protein n=1 Tax=Pseudomonas sp. 1152_12 TaxID=2604455 RepID=UPI004062EC0C
MTHLTGGAGDGLCITGPAVTGGSTHPRPGQQGPYTVQQYRYRVRRLSQANGSRPWARMLPLTLESVHFQYERVPDDPVCQH